MENTHMAQNFPSYAILDTLWIPVELYLVPQQFVCSQETGVILLQAVP